MVEPNRRQWGRQVNSKLLNIAGKQILPGGVNWVTIDEIKETIETLNDSLGDNEE